MSEFNLEQSRMIEFNEEEHRYEIDGKAHPSVSHILGELGIAEKFDGVNAGLLAARSARGKRIHLASQYYSQGILDMDSIAFDDKPFVEAIVAFHKDFPAWKSLMRERRFYVKCFDDEERGGELGYCGTIDDIMLLAPGTYTIMGRTYEIGENEIGIFDDKTSASLVPSYRYQVAGGYLMGATDGVDGDDLDMPLRDTIAAMIGGPVRKAHCFIRHLRQGHYFLVPMNEVETYQQWQQLIQKFFYPKTKLDVDKMIHNQIDLPLSVARRLMRVKSIEDAVKSRKESVRKDAIDLLTKDGMEYNGVAEINGRKVAFTKGFSGYTESIDDEAFIKKLLAWDKPFITMDEVHALRSSCKVGRETEGTWRLTIGKPKLVIETKKETKKEKPPKTETVKPTCSEMREETNPVTGATVLIHKNEKGEIEMPFAPQGTQANNTVNEPLPDFVISKDLVADLREVANRVFHNAIVRLEENDMFRGWSFSIEFSEFLKGMDMESPETPINTWTEGMVKDLIDALVRHEIKRTPVLPARDPSETLADVLVRTIMTAYGISRLDATTKISDHARARYGEAAFYSFDDSRLREIVNEMGKMAADESLKKRGKTEEAAPEKTEPLPAEKVAAADKPDKKPKKEPAREPKERKPRQKKTADNPQQPGLFD